MSAKPDLGRFASFGMEVTPQDAAAIESLGYGAVWVAGSPPAELDWVEPALEATSTLKLATGIVNIWTARPEAVAASFHRIESAYPERFLLGVGVGHPEADAQFTKPLTALNDYLDVLDQHHVPRERRVLAALGPQVLALSARRSAGAHPVLITPEHTAQARQLMGSDAFLAPAIPVVPTTDIEQARAVGRTMLEFYLGLSNYLNNWKRLGFTDSDLARPGSDRFVDSLLVSGSPETIASRLSEHLDAGADHVAIQLLTPPATVVETLAELAGPLGLG